MAKFNYSRSAQTAQKLIDKFGGKGVVHKMIKGSGKPTFTPFPVDLVILEYEDRDVDGTRVKASDRLIYVSTRNFNEEITSDDTVTDVKGATYAIVRARPLSPADTTVYWELQGRR